MVNSGTNPNDHWILTLIAAVPWIILVIAALSGIGICLLVLMRLEKRRRFNKASFTLLELTPPTTTEKTPLATSQLLNVLYELNSPHSLIDRLLGRRAIVSLEIVSSRSRGIRYMAYVAQKDAPTIKRDIVAYLPGARCVKAKNYLGALPKGSAIAAVEFHQTGHPSLPLSLQDDLNQHDPVSYMTGAMTQLKANELIVFQLLLTPTGGSWMRKRAKKAMRATITEDSRGLLAGSLRLGLLTLRLLARIMQQIVTIFRVMVLDVPSEGHRVTMSRQKDEAANKAELHSAMEDKLSQPLFSTNIRALIVASNRQRAAQRLRALESSLASFDVIGHQSLRARSGLSQLIMGRSHLANLQRRLPSVLPNGSTILSASEVAGIYHFPYSSSARAENVTTSLSRSLPAPVSLKSNKKLGVVLGVNTHNGSKTPIGLTTAERERHVYIVGGTGNGKTTMLLYGIEQDIRHDEGLAVIDPHGDLAESILKYIPKKRLNDVIYFNPDDVGYPIGLNLLEIPEGLSGDELVREKDLITETVISVFRKIFSDDDSGGHRIEYILRNTIQTALTMENATIFTIFRLLTNSKYRKTAVASLKDQDLKDFWNNEMGKAGEFQRIKMSAGITAKVGRFLFSGTAKRILGQPKSTIDFDDIVNSGKILVCNFSKGLLGEDTASLFGITVLAKLQIATLRRARLQPDLRKPFYLYVDEFQNFATMSFVQMMSEARKYKLFLTMAEQSTSQQEEQRIVNIILANVGTVICFRSASPADEQTLLPIFAPFIETGEIAYLPPFHFYIRIAATKPEAPFSGETLLTSDPNTQSRMQQVLEASRAKYALAEKAMHITDEAIIDIDDYEIDSPLALS